MNAGRTLSTEEQDKIDQWEQQIATSGEARFHITRRRTILIPLGVFLAGAIGLIGAMMEIPQDERAAFMTVFLSGWAVVCFGVWWAMRRVSRKVTVARPDGIEMANGVTIPWQDIAGTHALRHKGTIYPVILLDQAAYQRWLAGNPGGPAGLWARMNARYYAHRTNNGGGVMIGGPIDEDAEALMAWVEQRRRS